MKEAPRTRKESRKHKTNVYWLAYHHVIHNSNSVGGIKLPNRRTNKPRSVNTGEGSDRVTERINTEKQAC